MPKTEASLLKVLLPKYSPFDSIDSSLLETLAEDIEIKTADTGYILFESGAFDSTEFYLVSGSINLIARDGRENTISMRNSNARFPIARLRPRMYTAKAATPIHYFVIAASVLDELQRSSRGSGNDLVLTETAQNSGDDGSSLLYEFEQELNSGRFVLPSLPEVAFRIRELIDKPDFHMMDLAKLVNTDAAIAAKLIKAGNSVMYRGVNRCDDTLAAIARLGLITTKQLVTSFAVLALFNTKSTVFRDRMEKSWRLSMITSSYSYILAKHLPGFNEEEALLAGLIHNIGEVVLLAYAERFSDLANNENQLDLVINNLRGRLGEMVLSEWGFSQELVTVGKESRNWDRGADTVDELQFDYCDLVQVAMLYGCKEDSEFSAALPQIDSVPAYNKLKKRQISPEQVAIIIDEAQEQIADLQNIFS
ncbi:MAG: HD-like signal output (HDOD) protein [Oceanicoccus sp.]|jgi:HD-like signal output (HDOD) protein